jgi:hypothetical protein
MKLLTILLLMSLAACSQQDAPAEEIAEVAENIVDAEPQPAPPLAKGRFAPRDECSTLEGAAAFRAQIAEAVAARDTAAFVALAADDIQLDFGGGSGTVQLREQLDDPSSSLWDGLAQLQALGCAANAQGGMTLPWIFEQDAGVADPGAAMLVTGEDVPLRERAALDSPARGAVSWEVIELIGFQPEAPSQHVKLPDGTTGYLPTTRLRSLLDYRLVASSRNGRWRVTSLIAGD